jgi:hypothetical protein
VGPHLLRTQTIWRTLTPFWGEEYNLELESKQQDIQLTIFDEDLFTKHEPVKLNKIGRKLGETWGNVGTFESFFLFLEFSLENSYRSKFF